MRKICFITDSIFSIGGVQRVTAVIAKQLARDFDVTIVTFDDEKKMDTKLYGLEEAEITYRFFRYPEVSRLKREVCRAMSGFYLRMGLSARWASNLYALSSFPSERRNALVAELRQGSYDVIIGVHAPLAARLATIRKQLPDTKLVGWIHNSFEALFGDTSLYIGPQRKRHYVYQFRKLNKVVVLCQHDVETYMQYDAKFNPIAIYNPLTLKPGVPSEGNSKRFLAVGRFSHLHKGFDLLIEAFHQFAQTNQEWCLDIVGEGPEESCYRSLMQNYKLEGRVFLHPFTNRIQDYYSKAQIYVLSSRWEGFGLVLVEAMAHGLPVISSDLPTSKEIMGDYGIYFRNGDVIELAEKLEEATYLDWHSKSPKAKDIVNHFDVGRIVDQWKTLLSSLLPN